MGRSKAPLLTAELVARVHRLVEDTGPPPDLIRTNEADWQVIARQMLEGRPERRDVWLFAYGSLLWNPAVEHIDALPAVAWGWHRAFCMRMRDWRGTIEQPGLMMGLDRGGRAKGLALRLASDTVEVQFRNLVRREMPMRPRAAPPTNIPRWIDVQTCRGRIRAIAFVSDRRGFSYVGGLTPEETADILVRACGHGGSCAEYLYRTVAHLKELGIRDRGLWRLQRLVAERIMTRSEPSTSSGPRPARDLPRAPDLNTSEPGECAAP